MVINKVLILFICLSGTTLTIGQINERIVVDDDIHLIHLKDSIFVHVTWDFAEGYGRFSSNGLIIIREGEALMIDTPMDNEKTRRLTNYLKDSLSVELTLLIIGHFHDDCREM